MITLSNYIFESKRYTDVKSEVLKTLKVPSSWTTGNNTKLRVEKVDIPKKTMGGRQNGLFAYIYDENYIRIYMQPNFSYIKPFDYEQRVIKNLGNLSSIDGCSYNVFNNKDDLEKFTGLKFSDTSFGGSSRWPKVLISVPVGDKTEDKKQKVEKHTSKEQEPNNSNSNNNIKFWATSVGDTRFTYVAYGAFKDNDKPNLSRIQKNLGEKKFTMYYSNDFSKTFTSYKALYNFLHKTWKRTKQYRDFSIASEEKLVDSYYDKKYFILSL